MKKLFALLLCLVLLVSLVACGGGDKAEKKDEKESTSEITNGGPSSEIIGEETPSDGESEEAHDHPHVNYKGQQYIFTPEDLVTIEGRECDFTYDQNGSTMYIYNNLTIEGLLFTQVQFSFNEDHNRISCTYSVDAGSEEAPRDPTEVAAEVATTLQSYEQSLSAVFGEGTISNQGETQLVSWRDHTGNYVILTQINDNTIQLAYYIYAKQS